MAVVRSPEAMKDLGRHLGENLHAGDVLLLKGDLGAGKTALTQGIGAALGISGITSPTFVISRIHHGKETLVHVDAYRLIGESKSVFDDLDLDSHLATSIIVIEWGEGFVDRLADSYLEITIEFGSGENDRVVTSKGHGSRWRGFEL
ncbi:MAG: tRNA (adenosine(37)-N6)-threonylcarbamoyltransferase complex ATPase subunit type 1 TsaE [Actinomycetes bacterium]|jgi:tRNA threonylcarbamoyladenosine biosynthesis protein TsaE